MARKHLKALERAVKDIETARQRLGDLMLEAQESGETVVDIAEVTGLGRTRVYELINDAKRRRGKE